MTTFSKKKDRFFGIPLVCALGGLNADRVFRLDKNLSSVAFLRVGASKDIIISISFFEELRHIYPNCVITLFTDNTDIYPPIPQLNNVIKVDGKNLAKSSAIISASGVFDLWVDLGVWSRFEAVLSVKAKAKYKIGFRTTGEMRHFVYDKVVDYDRNLHLFYNIAKLASIIGLKIETGVSRSRLKPPPKPKSIVINMFPDNDGEKSRMWDMTQWKLLTESLSKKGYQISIIGDKRHAALADKFTESLSGNTDTDYLVGRLNSEALHTLIAQSSLLISVDALPLYVALRSETPVIGLFGATFPLGNYFAGDNGGNISIVANVLCSGCQNKYGDEKCFKKNADCMEKILWQDVEAAALKISENGKA